MKFRTKSVSAFALLVGVPVMSTGCQQPAVAASQSKGPAPIVVRSVDVTTKPVSRIVRSSGLLATKDELNLSFKVGGVLQSVEGKVGARVRKGQVLARLDGTEVSSMVKQAREAHAKATRDYDRLKALHDKGEVALVDLQNITTARAIAASSLEAAEFNERHTVITAPSDGWIISRKAEQGEVIGPGMPVFRFNGQGRGFVVRVGVSDRDVLALQAGIPAKVTIDALPGRVLEATISELGRSASSVTGTFDVELQLQSQDTSELASQLLSGLSAKVEITIANAASTSVPLSSLVDSRGQHAAVYAIDDQQRAHKVPVEIAFLSGSVAALRVPLAGVTRIATEGADALYEGAMVKVLP